MYTTLGVEGREVNMTLCGEVGNEEISPIAQLRSRLLVSCEGTGGEQKPF